MTSLLFLTILLSQLINLTLATMSSAAHHLEPRQIIEANPTVQCCESCKGRYGAQAFSASFNDLCTWAGNGLELVTTQKYYTENYYCPSPLDASVCMHLMIQFNCGGAGGWGANSEGQL